MKRISALLLLLLLAGCGAGESGGSNSDDDSCGSAACPGAGDRRAPPTSVVFDAGQSNAVGLALTAQQADTGTIQNVVVCVGDHWETYKPGKTFGPEHTFLLRWSADHPNEVLGLVKYAVGGTYMADWEVNWSPATAPNAGYGSLYQKLMAKHRQCGSLPVIATLWMQAEFDAGDATQAAMYLSRLQTFVSTVQTELGGAPFLIGLTQNNAYTQAYIADIRAAQLATAAAWHPYGVRAIPTDDLTVSDGVHLDTPAQLLFGERYYDTFILI